MVIGNVGCLLGTLQVTADKEFNRIVAEEQLQAQGLLAALFVQRNVCVSLQAKLQVPVGESVAEKMDGFSHNGSIEALASDIGKRKNQDMKNIFRSLKQAFESLLRLRMFLLILGPPLATVLALLVLFIVYWSAWTVGISGVIGNLWGFQWVQQATGLTDLSLWLAMLFLVMAFIPLAYVISVLIVSIFVMPVVLKWVGDQDFRSLEKRRGGTLAGSVWNTVMATLLFVVAFMLTLPLWLIPGFQLVVPLVLTAWLNKKVFLYDVLQDYASKEERKSIESEESGSLYLMGLLLGLLSYIPLAFFFVPIISALSYTYYGLNALEDRRK